MGDTRKITFLVNYPGGQKNIMNLIAEIRRRIKEIRDENRELDLFSLTDVGMCRMDGGVRVSLYFSQQEKLESLETERRAKV